MNRRLLVVASLAAAMVAFMMLYAWQKRVKEAHSPGEKVLVLVARAPIPAGTRITRKMLRTEPYSSHLLKGIHQEVGSDRLETVEGRTLARPLAKDEILRVSDFESDFRTNSLAQKVESGMRAVPLPIGELDAFSGLVQPGDRVDILAQLQHPDSGRSVVMSFLDDVEVLATGNRMTPGQGFGDGGTITLLLDRDSAAKARLVQRAGELVFLLRNPEDRQEPPAVDEFSIDRLIEPEVREKLKNRPRRAPRINVSTPGKG